MRTILPINQQWYYKPSFEPADVASGIEKERFSQVQLPHANIELPYNYFDDRDFRFVSCYKRVLSIPEQWQGRRIFIDFEGVMCQARVFVDGTPVGGHQGGYTPFSIELTAHVHGGGEHILTVEVDSTERPDIPPFGGTIDYLTYGGIYREAQLRAVPQVFIQDVFVKTPDVLADVKQLLAQVTLDGAMENGLALDIALLDEGRELAARRDVPVTADVCLQALEGLADIVLWSPQTPRLYQVAATLRRAGEVIDQVEVRMGFRQAQFRPDGFYLNGQRLQLRGLNRHQSFPYVGYAMPARVQRRDADILKEELGLNLVRTSHYPQSRHFLDRCDEIGLLVFEEIPGWQHIGDQAWKRQSLRDVREMILRDRNHPSIIIWGVRINESQDDHDFYTATNALAHELDDTRPTGGVRYLTGSELLEDVYTMNDFVHDNGYSRELAKSIRNFGTYDATQVLDGAAIALRQPQQVTGLSHPVPYMVTEYNGHMYPTKRFDQEERCVEHALRHARVQNASYATRGIAGAVGWCAFDYNTHADFGSGDQICYHGVMDMFRIPKFAAAAYRSQKSPQEEVVMEPATYWSRGERSIGGIIPLVVFTNCDEVAFHYNGKHLGTYQPDRQAYPALPHPPVVIADMLGDWGCKWEDGELVGYIGGKEAARRRFTRNQAPRQLRVAADDFCLNAGDMDATRVTVAALDQLGNTMAFLMEPVQVSVSGEGALIGPDRLSLIGGQTAFWVRTTGQSGRIDVVVESPRLGTQRITIEVKQAG